MRTLSPGLAGNHPTPRAVGSRLSVRASLGALAVAALAGLASAADAPSQDEVAKQYRALPWQEGPFQGAIGEKASMAVPKGAHFLAQGKTDRFFELTGNLPEPGATVIDGGRWFAVFGFTDSGYIKDDEKIDADAILKSIQDRDEPSNEERARRGLSKLHTLGWAVPPHYDPETKHLEWGIKLQAEGSSAPVVNYTVRLLGRSGYENVVLVADPQDLDASVGELRAALKNFEFNSGERYDQFRPGDHVAEFGLGALIVGGAAAVAVKTGFWKVLLAGLAASWKLVLGGLVAVGAAVRRLFQGRKAQQ